MAQYYYYSSLDDKAFLPSDTSGRPKKIQGQRLSLSEITPPLFQRNKEFWTSTRVFSFTLTLLTLLVACIIVTLAFSGHKPPSRLNKHGFIRAPCGNSAIEARALGCTWDVLSFCWLPEECLDRELTQHFREAGPWTYYTDRNKTTSVTEEEFGMNLQKVYLTNELHKTHCAFNWLKFHRALADGRMVHREDALSHTEHCTHVLREKNEPDDIKVSAIIQFPDCGYFSEAFPGKSK